MKTALCLLIALGIMLITLSCVEGPKNPVITEITEESSKDQVVTKITLERTACFGSCPVYKVTIFNDGTVRYKSRHLGSRKGTVDDNKDRP